MFNVNKQLWSPGFDSVWVAANFKLLGSGAIPNRQHCHGYRLVLCNRVLVHYHPYEHQNQRRTERWQQYQKSQRKQFLQIKIMMMTTDNHVSMHWWPVSIHHSRCSHDHVLDVWEVITYTVWWWNAITYSLENMVCMISSTSTWKHAQVTSTSTK